MKINIILPMPVFDHRPCTVDDISSQSVNPVLDLLGIDLPADLFVHWQRGQSLGST